MLFALMVMPRSFSKSMESSTCADISRWVRPPVSSIRRSASVDLPWSICAMMQKLRMKRGSIFYGELQVEPAPDYLLFRFAAWFACCTGATANDFRPDLSVCHNLTEPAREHRRVML